MGKGAWGKGDVESWRKGDLERKGDVEKRRV